MDDSDNKVPKIGRFAAEAVAEANKRRIAAEREARLQKALAALSLLAVATATGTTAVSSILSFFDKQSLFSAIISNKSLLWSLVGLFLSVASMLVLSIFLDKAKKTVDLHEVDRQAIERKRAIELAYLSKAGLATTESLDVVLKSPAELDGEPETKPEAYIDLSFMSDFGRYLSGLIRYLNAQIEQSDSKASVLLVTGKMYVRRGIYFFVASIIFWQVYGYLAKEISHVMVVGMVSCSLTFLVVEFLAAWFLRQYKEYVDAAIVYAKIKTQFDGIMLSYLSLKEFEGGGQEHIRDEMAKVLREPIVWPESVKGVDLNHMRQMFDSFSRLSGKLQPLIKKEADK